MPLTELIHADLTMHEFPFAYMVLERLSGVDLGDVYESLEPMQKEAIASAVVGAQKIVAATQPRGSGYGYWEGESPLLLRTWSEIVHWTLDGARRGIGAAGIVDLGLIERVATAVDGWEVYFANIEPVPFLHDTTTKNVIVDDGRVFAALFPTFLRQRTARGMARAP